MSNRLDQEASPYLRQHAGNPVDWWPWGADALAAARVQDKPILLSIGYSACHWCHVMAHESFEDAATARVMNDKFICIKVDREERPDLDKIYQLAHQALTRRGGGWPLTMFLAADDLTPFYAGTYFPKQARYGMPPFAYVLEQVRGLWDRRRDDVRAQNATLREFLDRYGDGEMHADALSDVPIRTALEQIGQNFDRTYGGHLGAPKFPHCAEMELLIDVEPLSRPERGWGEGGAADAEDVVHMESHPHPPPAPSPASGRREQHMVELTLTRMADGGIRDQIGGGFCRYSVDERWEIPHFEKMLYDNAQLLPLYAIRARATSNAQYLRAAQELVAWLAREMITTSAQSGGAFYAALDADSEGEEGKFYIWQRDEVRALLSDDEFAVAGRHYGLDRAPNFEGTHWNPIIAEPIAAIAVVLQRTTADIEGVIAGARAKLFAARNARVRPGLDDKILTAWNALMIAGLARAARALDAPALTALAANAIEFLHAQSWRDDRLFASHAGGAAKLPAYLDDYAFLLDALLEFLQCRWHDRHLTWAQQLADALLDRFEDRARGGFWFTANDHENLIQRPKPWVDDAVPSGNGIAARALLRLGHLLGETRYLDAAERTLRAAFSTMQSMPQACASLQRALNDFLRPRTHVVVRFDTDAEEKAWRSTLSADTPQRTDVYFIPAHTGVLGGILDAQKYDPGGAAYLCRGTQCLPPLATPQALVAALRAP